MIVLDAIEEALRGKPRYLITDLFNIDPSAPPVWVGVDMDPRKQLRCLSSGVISNGVRALLKQQRFTCEGDAETVISATRAFIEGPHAVVYFRDTTVEEDGELFKVTLPYVAGVEV